MTDFADFKNQIIDWANRSDWTDGFVTGLVRMAEEYLNQNLRTDRMIQFDEGLISARCAPLPDDWLEMDLVRMQNCAGADGYLPIRYLAREHLFKLSDNEAKGHYTIVGRTLFFGGAPDQIEGIMYKISYYGQVPVFSDDLNSWVYTKYPTLYMFAALARSNIWQAGEDDQALAMEARITDMVQKLNARHLTAKASGSRLAMPRTRSFG